MPHPWKDIALGTPGQRFIRIYEERHRRRAGGVARPALIAAGVGLLALGTFMILTPGPGMAVILVGASLLASESRAIARTLDRCEMKLRALMRRGK